VIETKHITSLAILVTLALVTLSCGSSGDLADEGGTEVTQPPADSGSEVPAPPAGFTWDDIPVYPDASVLVEDLTNSGVAALCETVEVRAYETQDEAKQVDSFYLDEMPKQGWDKALHLCRDDVCKSTWSKEDAKVQAIVVTVTDPDGATRLQITGAEGCNASD
jgi:hypothetical protein